MQTVYLNFWELPVSKRDTFTSAEHLDLTNYCKTTETQWCCNKRRLRRFPSCGNQSSKREQCTQTLRQEETKIFVWGETQTGGCMLKTGARRHAGSLQRKTEAFTVKHCHTVCKVPGAACSSQYNCMQSHWLWSCKEEGKKGIALYCKTSQQSRRQDSMLHQMAVNLTWQDWNVSKEFGPTFWRRRT